MSILIKGMKMPKNCDECRFHVDGWCYVLRPESEEERKRITTNYCPLIEIPPHGRLIDADEVKGYLKDEKMRMSKLSAMAAINNAATIIPAEEGE